jgi:hypothetical protein
MTSLAELFRTAERRNFSNVYAEEACFTGSDENMIIS